ncbi:hypothetical protein K3N28_20845 [Glycomyces sp. TRM65418]|uniref:hypothetical protein n=1 Tax=Glycomyces sp. TRM65418 TaxID=2867006 RepID=UPI001CE5D4EC|nr:hypothetical protein [Glycomyces sp. TRM65418]MCC3765513.1 hypothetical protein [Glycomyces sp. TRM65418]QZD55120.1 hypothetical protein K3N28_20740 [Glycomyces sp. TRM65418]
MLGIDVHDRGVSPLDRVRSSAVGGRRVLTVELGRYFQPDDEFVPETLRGNGIRIEDHVHNGFWTLSAGLPRTAAEAATWPAAQREAGPRLPPEYRASSRRPVLIGRRLLEPAPSPWGREPRHPDRPSTRTARFAYAASSAGPLRDPTVGAGSLPRALAFNGRLGRNNV